MNIDFDDQLIWKKIKCVGNNSDIKQCNVQKELHLHTTFFCFYLFCRFMWEPIFWYLIRLTMKKKRKKNSPETQWLEIKRTGYRNGKRVLPFIAPLFHDLHILLSHQTIIPRFNISLLMDVLRAQFSQNKPRSILYWFCVAKQLNGPNKFIPNNLPSDMNFYHFLTFKYIHHYLTR